MIPLPAIIGGKEVVEAVNESVRAARSPSGNLPLSGGVTPAVCPAGHLYPDFFPVSFCKAFSISPWTVGALGLVLAAVVN